MAIKADEKAQLQTVKEELRRAFPDLPRAAVDTEVSRALQRFTGARVRTFVPVMVQKQARTALLEASGRLVRL